MVTERFKELAIDVLIKIDQILFAILIVGQFVKEKINSSLLIYGGAGCIMFLLIAAVIALSIKGKEEA